MTAPLEDIPAFLRLSQDERKAAWEKSRAAKPLPPEPAPRRIPTPPGAPTDGDA